mmetsp:Transcript_18697/g.38407  ORF Transcript_18697/g.38407 Transcript_18697/m.38407 type:complete len:327 (-) Transcript_18697:311-1291(-)
MRTFQNAASSGYCHCRFFGITGDHENFHTALFQLSNTLRNPLPRRILHPHDPRKRQTLQGRPIRHGQHPQPARRHPPRLRKSPRLPHLRQRHRRSIRRRVGPTLSQDRFRHSLDEIERSIGRDGIVGISRGGETTRREGEGRAGVRSADGSGADFHSFAVAGEGYFLEAVVDGAGVGDAGFGGSDQEGDFGGLSHGHGAFLSVVVVCVVVFVIVIVIVIVVDTCIVAYTRRSKQRRNGFELHTALGDSLHSSPIALVVLQPFRRRTPKQESPVLLPRSDADTGNIVPHTRQSKTNGRKRQRVNAPRRHFVLGEGAGLVGANDRGGS